MAKNGGGCGFLILVVLVAVAGFGYYRSESGSSADPPEPPGSSTGDGTGRYVALGDSYTSAPRTGEVAGTPPGCARSDNNYPHRVAAELGPAEFVDVSCGAATTRQLAEAQQTKNGTNPPQLDAVDDATTLVTLGMGGNDVGFIELAGQCSTVKPGSAQCRDRFTAGGGDELADRIDAAAERVGAAIGEIKARAPKAKVVIVGYPTILPDGDGCWPSVPVGAGDVHYLRDSLARLNDSLAKQAERNGAGFADTAAPTKGHDVCTDSSERWVEGLIPTSKAVGLHPNAKGSQAMADAVLRVAK